MRSLRPLLALVLLANCPAVLAGVNTWTPTGADGGFARSVVFDPSGVLLAGTPGAIYRSTDNGQSWTAALTGAGVFAIVFDPTNPSRVMACDPNKLWRSDDGGQTFGATTGPGGSVFKLAAGSDGSLYAAQLVGKVFRSDSFGAPWMERSQGLPNEVITDLVVDPQNPNTVYALVQSNGLYKSVNGGVSWASVTGSPSGSKVAVDPANSANLLLVANGNLYESGNGGASWTVSAGLFAWVGFYPSASTAGGAVAIAVHGTLAYRTDRNSAWQTARTMNVSDVYGVAFDPRDATGRTFLLATSEEPWWTQDSGVTFAVRSHGLRGSFVTGLVAANDTAGTIYAGYASGPVGVHRRTAAGWIVADNTELKSRLVSWFGPQAMAVDPKNADVLWVSSIGEVVHTTDGGQSWSQPHPGLAGLTRTLAFDPFNSQILYAGSDTGGSPTPGVYRSVNGGATWSLSSTGLSKAVGVISADGKTPGTLYAAPFNATAPPVIYKSTDQGSNWLPADTGLALSWINAIVVDPSDAHVLYAGGYGVQPGLAKSVNAGQSWQSVGAMPGTPLAFGLAVDPVVPSNVFVSRDSATGAPARSVDGGATWEDLPIKRLADPLTNLIVLDPLKPSIVIATDDRYGLVEYEVAPDLEATLQTPPVTLSLGGAGSLTVRVTNHGPLAASAVKLTLSTPTSFSAATAAPGKGTCSKVGGAFECALGAVRLNQTVDTQLMMTAGNVPDQSALNASVVGHESDPATGNNTLSVPIVTDRVANVGIMLSSSASTVDPQGQLTLTATASNAGPNPSTDTQVVIQIGAGLTYQSVTASQGACTASGAVVTCAIGAIAVDAQATAAVTVTASGSGTLAPSAQISATGIDSVATNNSAATSIAVNVPPSSGGGGASGIMELLALLGTLIVSARSRPVQAGRRC